MSDEEALRSMGSHFQLGRIRESTRARFEKAIKLARRSPP